MKSRINIPLLLFASPLKIQTAKAATADFLRNELAELIKDDEKLPVHFLCQSSDRN